MGLSDGVIRAGDGVIITKRIDQDNLIKAQYLAGHHDISGIESYMINDTMKSKKVLKKKLTLH